MRTYEKEIKGYMMFIYPEFKQFEELKIYLKENCVMEDEKIITDFQNSLKQESAPEAMFVSQEDYNEVVKLLKKEERIFPEYFAYFIQTQYRGLKQVFSMNKNLELEDSLFNKVVQYMYNTCFQNAIRTLLLELSDARENHLLVGNKSAERFQYFEKEILGNWNNFQMFHSEYRMLYLSLLRSVKYILEYVTEILEHTSQYSEKLNEMFGGDKGIGKLKDIQFSAGDTHNNFRSVAILVFENTKIVYKPHSLQSDKAFQEILEYINEVSQKGPVLRTMKIVCGEGFGWTEYIEHRPCQKMEDVSIFYQKAGVLLGILYLFNASDFHFENMIADGNNPVLIDLETLFHCNIPNKTCENDPKSGYVTACWHLNHSVFSIGILPTYMHFKTGEEKRILNFGGLSESLDQKSPFFTYHIEDVGLDTMHFSKQGYEIEKSQNSPVHEGMDMLPQNYSKEIMEGFRWLYETVLRKKDIFTKLVISKFHCTRNRIVLKATMTYSQLLNIATYPDFQRDEIFSKFLFSRIGLVESASQCVDYEIHALMERNVPIYYADFSKCDIINGNGGEYSQLLKHSPMEEFLMKMQMISEEDLERQCSFIRTSYYERNMEANYIKVDFFHAIGENIEKERYLQTAINIGDYLVEKRSFSGINQKKRRDRFWIGCSLEKTEFEDWMIGLVDFKMYDGASGIALFLLYLAKISGEEKYLRYAYESIEPVRCIIEDETYNYERGVGSFSGISGYFYVLYKFATVNKDKQLMELVKKRIVVLAEFAGNEGNENLDLISGIGGAIAVLVRIEQTTDDFELKKIALNTALSCYETLYQNTIDKNGLAYIRYSGFAHGIAGIIPYLFMLYKTSGRKDIYHYTMRLLECERQQFQKRNKGFLQGWFGEKKTEKVVASWCHGSCGFLLERLLLKQAGYKDSYIEKEIEFAVDHIKKEGIGTIPVYCHGDLGNLSILKMYATIYGDKELFKRCNEVFSRIFVDYLEPKWNNQEAVYSKYSGLMVGQSGIGYSCLEAIYPEISNFLWLE